MKKLTAKQALDWQHLYLASIVYLEWHRKYRCETSTICQGIGFGDTPIAAIENCMKAVDKRLNRELNS